jgi:hypothetical protein
LGLQPHQVRHLFQVLLLACFKSSIMAPGIAGHSPFEGQGFFGMGNPGGLR